MLFTAGVIDEIGSVDSGSTQTDSLELERRRGITIKSAVASFDIRGVTVNLIDTPGHPDFIAEVERVLGVLGGVVLVISAAEGVQAQTRVLMRALQRHAAMQRFPNRRKKMGTAETGRGRPMMYRMGPNKTCRAEQLQYQLIWPLGAACLANGRQSRALIATLDDYPLRGGSRCGPIGCA